VIRNQLPPDAATSESKLAAEIADKGQYAHRWQFSRRTVDNLIREGLPHIAYGRRRIRIVVAEADEWMRRRYGQQRRKLASTTNAFPKAGGRMSSVNKSGAEPEGHLAEEVNVDTVSSVR
jgi:hypothetical protein